MGRQLGSPMSGLERLVLGRRCRRRVPQPRPGDKQPQIDRLSPAARLLVVHWIGDGVGERPSFSPGSAAGAKISSGCLRPQFARSTSATLPVRRRCRSRTCPTPSIQFGNAMQMRCVLWRLSPVLAHSSRRGCAVLYASVIGSCEWSPVIWNPLIAHSFSGVAVAVPGAQQADGDLGSCSSSRGAVFGRGKPARWRAA